ncbi:MAG: hypothetical protein KAJ62_07190 [Desulfobacteraceae bacterium]|nr:hypothetical protein [Desulfobacteraceae bacterium]
MIKRDTVTILSLKPVTRKNSYDFYVKINSEFENSDALEESISWWQEDHKKLNELWWVLNYHSEEFDPERRLRAVVERKLDTIAEKRKSSSDL